MYEPRSFFRLVFLLTCLSLHSQTSAIPDNPGTGDTSQVYITIAKTGDRYAGRIKSRDQEKIAIVYLDQFRVSSNEEIQSFEIVSDVKRIAKDFTTIRQDTIVPSGMKDNYSPLDYGVTTRNGDEYIGTILKINKDSLTLQQGEQEVVIKDEIVTITLLGELRVNFSPNCWKYHSLRTSYGKSFRGQLLSFDGKVYVFIRKDGQTVSFPVSSVAAIRVVTNSRKIKKNIMIEEISPNFKQHRIYFTPTAFLLEKGVRELRTVGIHTTYEQGIFDYLSLGTGFFIFPYESFGISAKVKFGGSLNKYIHMAGGLQGFGGTTISTEKVPNEKESITMGLMYGSLAFGTRDHFINFLLGFSPGTNDSDDNLAVYSINGSFRLGKHWRFFFEDLTFVNEENLPLGPSSIGLSWFNYKHQVDIGLFLAADEYFYGFPIAGYSYKF